MNRSKWKGPFFKSELVYKKLKIMSRNSKILPKFIGMNCDIHNGQKYMKRLITKDMIGRKFGEFSFTRKHFSYKKKKKKNN